MWPQRGEALSRTLECEAALADVYAEALNEWVVATRSMVVPDLAGVMVNGNPALVAASIPPDPDAAGQNAGLWDQLSTTLILACLSTLWSMSLVETMTGLDIPLPDINLGSRPKPTIPAKVSRAITSTSSVARSEVIDAVHRVESHYELRQARDEYIERQRESVAATPTLVRDKVAAAVRDAAPDTERIAPIRTVSPAPSAPPVTVPADEPTPDPAPSIEVVIERQREAAAAVLTPGSEAVRDVARYQGYQAAGVQNAAVIEAGKQSPDEDLQKVWIATIDGKTRDTHFAADGQRAPLAGSFSVGGSSLRYPGDPDGPPSETRNCRCRVGVLAADEDIPDEVDRHTERLDGRDSVARNRQGSQADEIERRKGKGVVRARDDEDGIGRTASGAPSEQEYEMNGRRGPASPAQLAQAAAAAVNTTLAAEDDEQTEAETFRTFTDQPIAFVGIETSDGRMLSPDIDFSVRTPPMPVMWVKQTGYGHEDAYTVGVMEAARIDGDKVLASGYILNSAESDEAAGQLEHTATRPSVDLARTEWRLVDEDGNEITEEQWWDMPMDAKVIQQITAAELIGVTLVATPAFGDTMLQLNGEREVREPALVASAAEEFRPRVYPAGLFAAPNLTEPTLPTMDPDTGRIFGHLACFGTCHRSIQAECTIAPRSPSNYAHFHTSPAVRLDDGTSVPVGRLTVGTGHAPDALGAAPAKAHYDNTGACFALVRVYETSVGVEFSGVAAPWATPEQIEQGLAAPLSGDWRNLGQGLDLIAALAVNTPGFAVRGREGADGRPLALVAALGPNPRAVDPGSVQNLSAADIASIVEAAVNRVYAQRETDAEITALLAAADEKVGPPPAPKTPNDEIAEMLAGMQR